MIGKQISHYQIMEELGRGGMGVVYKAEDTNLKRIIALKFLSPQTLGNDEDKQRFMREAQAAAALDHPNICTVYEIDEADGNVFMAMPYVEGVSLSKKIEEKPMKLDQALDVAIQISQGLQEAHEKDIVHRDIKSSNIMLTEKGQAKIMDFGLAKQGGQTMMTKEGTTLGTISYMSPEQARGEDVDARTDIWSFGVMLYEMIAGQLPFKGEYEQAVVYSIMNEEAEPLTAIRTGVPMELERIVNKAMAKNQYERYQRIEDMEIDLRAVQKEVDTSSTTSRTTSTMPMAPEQTLIKNLLKRRIPQILGVYFAFSFGVVQFVDWLVRNYPISPNLPEFCFITLASMIPTVLLLAYFHGEPGRNRWTRVEQLGIPANLLAVIMLLFFIFQDKELGAAVEKVTVTDEEGKTVERVILKSEFHKRLAIFYFDNETGDSTYDWLQYALPTLIDIDLEQDHYFINGTGWPDAMIEAGFKKGVGAPLTLKKSIASKYHYTYFLTGSFSHADNTLALTTKIYESKNAKLIDEHTFSSSEIFELVDSASLQLKHDLGIPDYHIEQSEDLPVADMASNSIPALELFFKTIYEGHFANNFEQAALYMEEAVKLDPTFSYAYYQLHKVYLQLNQKAKAERAISNAIQHKYKLPEMYRFLAKNDYYEIKEAYQQLLDNAKTWVKLYPAATVGHHSLADAYMYLGKLEEAVQEHKIIYELDPAGALELHHIGRIYDQQGKYAEALTYYQQYADLFPEEVRSFNELGDTYRYMGDYVNAKATYKKALLIDPEEISILVDLAKVELKLGNFQEAFEQFQAALAVARTPMDSSTVHGEIVLYYGLRGQITRAIEEGEVFLAQAKKFQPPIGLTLSKVFKIYFYAQVGRENEALAILQDIEAQQMIPQFSFFPSLGYSIVYATLEDADKTNKAVNDLDSKTKIEQFRHMVFWLRGQALALKEQYLQAIEFYQKALDADPGLKEESFRLGACYRKLGELTKAEEIILENLKLEPMKPEAHYEIALVYWDMGKNDKALEHLNTALQVWEDADAEFKPAIKAREKLAEWSGVVGG